MLNTNLKVQRNAIQFNSLYLSGDANPLARAGQQSIRLIFKISSSPTDSCHYMKATMIWKFAAKDKLKQKCALRRATKTRMCLPRR